MKKMNLMLQGTASSVGKSMLTAGICRVLKDMDYSVAPFKSQNMSLNSFITKDGKEMSRAQVVQAEACKIEPMAEMNPILLKPSADFGSQVILMGEVYDNMAAIEYDANKPRLKEYIKEIYNRLNEKYDVIIIEGAGSTAEINLRENDIVNMGMAEMVDAPVILIGDIDRGGVFASLYGTYMLFTEEEKARVKGFIINKFRGNVKLLEPGVKMLEELMPVPCLGVVPYTELYIDDEDSVSISFDYQKKGSIVIGVLRLPHISNFTDFTPFDMEQDVEVKYIRSVYDFGDIDLLVIPGSKNTIEDMIYLNNSGLTKKIIEHYKDNLPIIGIGGGYQILGKEIIDNENVSLNINKTNGVGLLGITSTLKNEKQTEQVQGKIDISFMGENLQTTAKGYKIPMGITKFHEEHEKFIYLEGNRFDGAISKNGNVLGTYLHGIFENDSLRQFILNNIRKKKGIDSQEKTQSFEEFKENEYIKLANVVKESLDIDKIIEIMGSKIKG